MFWCLKLPVTVALVQLQWLNKKMQKDLTSLLGLIYLYLITFETEVIKIEILFSKLKIFAIFYKLALKYLRLMLTSPYLLQCSSTKMSYQTHWNWTPGWCLKLSLILATVQLQWLNKKLQKDLTRLFWLIYVSYNIWDKGYKDWSTIF